MFSPTPDGIDPDSDYAASLYIQTLMEYDTETGDQRAVYSYGNQYLKARYYRPGTGNFLTMDSETGDIYVLDSEGHKFQVEEKYVEKLEESVKVYNFEVEELHTYYVGDAGILVHNTCMDPSVKKAAENSAKKESPNKYGRKERIPHQNGVKKMVRR